MYQQIDNSRITTVLNYLVTQRLLDNKIENANALQNAINNINNVQFQIQNGVQAKTIPGVGVKTGAYIDGILSNINPNNCGIYEIDNMSYEQKVRLVTITDMSKIPDIGVKRAANYYDAGYNTVDKLKEMLKTNGSQRTQLALQHEGQLERRIPREKIDIFMSNFNSAISTFNSTMNSSLNYDVGGSYVRGKPDSGDIDILIWSFNPKEVLAKQPVFLEYLNKVGILIGTQVLGSIIYQGVAYIDKDFPAVRIDIKALPDLINYHYALFHLIGPGSFNTKMSDIAKSKGWTLGSNGMIINTTGDQINVRSQDDIFTLLGQNYIIPQNRN